MKLKLVADTPYHILTCYLSGSVNPDAAIGNPMKGLIESPKYTRPPYSSQVPLSLEFYYMYVTSHAFIRFFAALHSLTHFFAVVWTS